MKKFDFKKQYGEEYPAVMVESGVRMLLGLETPFTRYYYFAGNPKQGSHVISRFMDGSASMTVAELQRDWPAWTNDRRIDFCQSCVWLDEQDDYADMLRFIMGHGSPEVWGAIALKVATALPREEAFPFLLDALHAVKIGSCSNITQAIAETKHPDAESVLRQHLRATWEHPGLWADDKFINWAAYDATTCIEHLIEIGASPADFEDQVRKLSQHVCSRNRDSCQRRLVQYYPVLE